MFVNLFGFLGVCVLQSLKERGSSVVDECIWLTKEVSGRHLSTRVASSLRIAWKASEGRDSSCLDGRHLHRNCCRVESVTLFLKMHNKYDRLNSMNVKYHSCIRTVRCIVSHFGVWTLLCNEGRYETKCMKCFSETWVQSTLLWGLRVAL